MARGKDGYEVLSKKEGAEEVVDEENGVLISMILRQYFLSLKVLGKWSRGGFYHNFFGELKQDMKAKGSLVQSEAAHKHEELDDDDQASGSENENDEFENIVHEPEMTKEEKIHNLVKKAGSKWARLAGVKTGDSYEEQDVNWTSSISPKVEGRIVNVKKEQLGS